MRPADTSEAAWAHQMALLRDKGSEWRGRRVFQMSEGLRELTRVGIRNRHPEYDPQQVDLALRRLLFGDDLFAKAYPDKPLLEP